MPQVMVLASQFQCQLQPKTRTFACWIPEETGRGRRRREKKMGSDSEATRVVVYKTVEAHYYVAR